VLLVADALDGLAAGTTGGAVTGVVETLDLDGYAALGLQLALLEADASLERAGAYGPEGLLSERGQATLAEIAAGLRGAVEDQEAP